MKYGLPGNKTLRFILNRWVRWQHRLLSDRRRSCLRLGLWLLGILLTLGVLFNTFRLMAAAAAPVDTLFVLGGSIQREVAAAELVKQHPQARVLISHGSLDPCILLIFQKFQAPIRQVWLEKCANSTFGNFYFNIPRLRLWGVRKVRLITSPSHLPRAKWMAQILLGAHGIWVDVESVKELGIPGNRESWLKTGVDVARSLIWALASQAIQPQCSQLTRLTKVDLATWRKSGYTCEYQWWLKLDK
ncbi:MAG TPA: hypothetical protein DDZ80_02900 [Cyanobacteria bacterium UBA8803]|nr:hypothetical protein [Cyanobacteria bacterium UBA9273]HBL57527.1 hypothetical protein [Cyanobacteria bacterium UBA8803]